MKNKFLALIIVPLLFSACNEDSISQNEELPDVEVAFNAVIKDSNSTLSTGKTGEYARENAPVYVSGVQITATNLTYSFYNPIDATFLFADGNDGQAMTMVVKPGENRFDAVSLAATPSFTEILDPFDRVESSVTDLDERAAEYAKSFTMEEYPISVEYEGSTTTVIDFADAQTVELDMTAKQGRINIVFEAEQDLKYRLTANLVTEEVPDVVEVGSVTVLENNDLAGGFIFNQVNMIEGTYVSVKIEKSPHDNENWESITDTGINIPTKPGMNYTHLIRFDGEETSEAGFNLTFELMTEYSSSTLIN